MSRLTRIIRRTGVERRRREVAFACLLALALGACTGGGGGETGAPSDDAPAAPGDGPPDVLVLGVVASETGPTSETDRTYLDGMRLAAGEINEEGGVAGLEVQLRVLDDRGGPRGTSGALSRLLREVPAAARLVVGPGSAVAGRRSPIEEAGGPVLLLGGDLYTPRALFRQVFQTGVPARWQARVLARYLVRDRGHRLILLVHEPGADGARSRDAFALALREEGVPPAGVFPLDGGEAPARFLRAARRADAVVVIGSAESAAVVSRALAGLAEPPQLALSSDSLRSDFPGRLPPGAVAPYPYAWAGWARPIRRVERFIRGFERAFGRPPVGFEQEGYDAVRLLADALARTEGRGGELLVRALESNRPRGPLFSALPLVLGPDDHTLTDETFLGLFAVAGPGEEPEPWVAGTPWRPIVRTFTFDGQRTSFLERDRRVFFPSWREGRPSPKFGRSRYGITTRAGEDPVH